MKKYLPLLLVSSVVYAETPLFMRVLENLNRDGVIPAQERSCSDQSQEQALAQECAQKLCGPSQTAKTAYVTEDIIPDITKPEVMELYKDAVDPINTIIERDTEVFKKIAKSMREKLKGDGLALKAENLNNDNYNSLADSLFGMSVVSSVDYTKPLAERLSFDYILPDDVSPTERAAVVDYARVKGANAVKSFSEGCYQELYQLSEAQAEMKKYVDQFKERLAKARAIDPVFLKDDQENIERIIEQTESGYGDVYSIGNDFSYLLMYDSQAAVVTSEPARWVFETEPTCATEVCRNGVLEWVNTTDWSKQLKSIERQVTDDTAADRYRVFCRTNAATVALKDSEKEQFEAMMPRIRQQFDERVLSRFSQHSRDAFNKILDTEMNYVFENRDADFDSYLYQLKSEAESTAEEIDYSNNYALVNKLLETRSMEGEGEVSVMNNLNCAQGLGATAWDAFSPIADETVPGSAGKNNVFISFFSCSHPAMGEQVFAHEIGHVMSYAFKEKKLSESSMKEFLKDRACMTKLTGDSTFAQAPSFLKHPGDKFRTEEDTADLIAFRFGQGNSAIMSCALVGPTPDRSAYDNPSLTNSIALDSHSSPLTRAVREAIHKGIALPSACKSLVDAQTEQRFDSCL